MTFFRTLTDTAHSGATLLSLELAPLRRKRGPRAGIRNRDGRQLALFAPFPPHTGAGVHRPLSFVQYGARLGWRIDVFVGPPPDNESEHGDELLARVPPLVRRHMAPPSSRQPSYNNFPRVDGGFTKAIAHAVFAIDALRHDPPDVVLASGPPFFTFVAARFVARRFGVPLVLDYRDEWTECPFDFVRKDGDDLKWERRCLTDASAVLFATPSFLNHQLQVFPQLDRRKARVVPNGWDPDDFAIASRDATTARRERDAVVRVAHVGALSGHTPPFEFLESVRRLLADRPEWISRLRISFVGRRSLTADAAIRELPYPEVVEIVDQVEKRDAIRRMHEADVLLVLSAPGLERYLPSKLFEYLAARRPVLIFGSAGESSALVDKLGAGLLCPSGSSEALGDALTKLRDLDLSPHERAVSAWLQDHRRDVLAARAFDTIESVISATREEESGDGRLSEARSRLARRRA